MRTEDGYIINKCLNGDKEAFGLLVDKYKAGIYALALSKLHDFHDAEDVTQNVFIKAFQKLHTLRRWDSFLAWLCSITYNLCSKHIRSKVRRPDGDFIEDQNPVDLETSYVNSYRNALVNESLNEMNETINKALESLPENYQQVITLHYFNNMDSIQIAKFLGISPEAVRQRLARARSELKEGVLNMMSVVFEQQKRQRLHAIFTFRIVEAIKRVRMEPASPLKGLPWGLSLATGLITVIIGICTNINLSNENYQSATSIIGESKVLNVGEFPVDVMKVSDIPSMANSNGNGSGDIEPSPQNALFMAPQAEGGTWTKKADMPTMRSELCACMLNNKIYVIGGMPGTLSIVEEYDPSSNSWIKKADIPTGRFNASASAVNGKIYVIGGLDKNNEAISTVEEYDPATNKWTKKADMPTARYGLSVNSIHGRIYAIGGGVLGGIPEFSTVEEYDPENDKWVKKTDMPTGRSLLSASVVGEKIYAIGGWRLGSDISIVEEYDPKNDKWVKKANMLTARNDFATGVAGGKIYAFGGQSRNFAFFSIVEEYDPITDKWINKADMPTARYGLSASSMNDKIYVIGGGNNNGHLKVVEEYDPQAESKAIDFKGKLPTTWGDTKLAQNR